jgi:hypothetical protein
MKFLYLRVFKNMPRKFKFHQDLTRITATLHGDQYKIFIISRSFLLTINNVSNKSCRGYQNTHFMFNNFLENRALYEKMWKNIVEPYRSQMIIQRMGIACWIIKATDSPYQYVILAAFVRKNGCTNAPQFYIIRTLPVLFQIYRDCFPLRNSPTGFCSVRKLCFLQVKR